MKYGSEKFKIMTELDALCRKYLTLFKNKIYTLVYYIKDDDTQIMHAMKSLLQKQYKINDTMIKTMIALRPDMQTIKIDKLEKNMRVLEKYIEKQEIKSLICRCPKLLEADVHVWEEFMTAYGVRHMHVRNFLLNSYQIVCNTNIYDFGMKIMYLKSVYGFNDDEITGLYIPYFLKKITNVNNI